MKEFAKAYVEMANKVVREALEEHDKFHKNLNTKCNENCPHAINIIKAKQTLYAVNQMYKDGAEMDEK